jgi:hypothetical protein
MTVGNSILNQLSPLLLILEDDCFQWHLPCWEIFPLMDTVGRPSLSVFPPPPPTPPPPSMFWVGEMWACHLTILTFFIYLPYRDSRGTYFKCVTAIAIFVFTVKHFFGYDAEIAMSKMVLSKNEV